MSTDTFFTVVERTPQSRTQWTGFSAALCDTLTSGKAVAVPLDGESYAVVRNRKAGTGTYAARKMNAAMRTGKSLDGLSLLIWLEPKE